MIVAAISAIVAAALFAVASAFQHRSAGDVAGIATFWPRDLLRFARGTLSQRGWVIGLAAEGVGLGFHALALSQGPLTVVQPLLVLAVLFALPLRSWLDHRRPGRRSLVWAGILVAGLVVFLVAAIPPSSTGKPSDPLPAVITATGLAVTMIVATAVGLRGRRVPRALVLGIAAGLGFAATAALIKETTVRLAEGPVVALTSWPLWILVAVGVTSLLLNQLAFEAGPIEASLPTITTVNPVASLVIGVAVFDEALRTSTVAVALSVLGLAAVVLATLVLTRADPDESRRRGEVPGGAVRQPPGGLNPPAVPGSARRGPAA